MKAIALYLTLLLVISLDSYAVQAPEYLSLKHDGFLENKGQVRDQHGKQNDKVKFLFSEGSFNLQLKSNGFSYEVFEIIGDGKSFPEYGQVNENYDEPRDLTMDHSELRSHRIDVKFEGSSSKVEIFGSESTGTAFNFYLAGLPVAGITGVQSFEKVIYRNIYPSIDLVFYAPDAENESPLKYEWIIHPGGNADKIKLRYSGADALTQSKDGGFQLLTASGTIEESKVIAFLQDDQSPVVASYRFEGTQVSYAINSIPNKTIIIDPNIVWSSYYGGNLNEDVNNGEMAVDGQNKPIIAGSTASTQYIASTGAHQTSYGGGYHDAILAKFTANGNLEWATYYGGTEKDEGHAVLTDASNNIYLGGLTVSQTAISTPGSYQPVFGGWQDNFIAKFTPAGVRVWATYMGGEVQDEILDLDCDTYGNIYFTGYTTSPDHIATPGAYQENINNSGGNNGDAFIGEFTPGGKLVWCSYFSGPLQDRGWGVAVGKNGDLFLEGTVESETGIATAGAHQTTYGGGISDAFLSKWDTNGVFKWATYYGGSGEDHGRGVKTDEDGNAYIMGWTSSLTGLSTPGAVQANWAEAYEADGDAKPDGFMGKFHPDGTWEWGTYYGGKGKEQTLGLAIDNDNGILYAAGYSSSTINISTPGSFQPVYTGTTDGFLVKFALDGERVWGSYFGAGNNEELHGTVLGKNGFLYLFLSTDGGSFAVSPGTYQSDTHGGWETVVAKFNVADACYDSFEPNNSPAAAKTLKTYSDTTLYGYNGSIATGADADWFKVKVDPTNLKIVLSDLVVDFDLKLYKKNGQLIKSSINTGTANETIIYNNLAKGTYYILVDHLANVFAPLSCYRIKTMTSTSPWILKEGDEMIAEQYPFQAQVFPNPCVNDLNVKFTPINDLPVIVNLYSLLGQKVATNQYPALEGTQFISMKVDNLKSGMYLLELTQGETTTVQKVLIQH